MMNNVKDPEDFLNDEDDVNRWLLPYADFITLLFAVFVVMYAVSNVEESKLKSLSESLKVALNTQEKESKDLLESSQLNSIIESTKTKEENLIELSAALKNDLAPLLADNKVRIIKNKGGISIEINDSLLFKSGQALIEMSFDKDLAQIANILKKYPNPIQVEGHTDNNKINTGIYPSNWELSSARASVVVRGLIANGVAEKQLSAVGFAANQPIDTNLTDEGRYHNRRVTIKILGSSNATDVSETR
jgi:chemotaxis protein MotB